MFEMLFYEEPVAFPVMATLVAILTLLRFSSGCVCAVVNLSVETAKTQVGAGWPLLLASLLLVIALHCSSSSATAMEKPLCWDYSWVLLFLFTLLLLYMALKQHSFRQSLFFYYV
ncbi:hypothetical protein REPUB_Repub03eG0149800 [Reevesia pubescens]